jgi:hypothetical protein
MNGSRLLRAPGLSPKKLNSIFSTVTLHGTDDVDPYDYVISANLRRRHLTAEEKRAVIAKILKVAPEKSNRQVAKVVGVSHPHVAKVRQDLEKAGDVETVTTSIDTKGRKQPAKKQTKERKATAAVAADVMGQLVQTAVAAATQQAMPGDIGPIWDEEAENPLIVAWDNGTSKQRAGFLMSRKVEVLKAQQLIGKFAYEQDDVVEPRPDDDGLDIPDYLKRVES